MYLATMNIKYKVFLISEIYIFLLLLRFFDGFDHYFVRLLTIFKNLGKEVFTESLS
jgi:hypothetical protein